MKYSNHFYSSEKHFPINIIVQLNKKDTAKAHLNKKYKYTTPTTRIENTLNDFRIW